MKTAVKERPKATPAQADQAAPPASKSADELHAEVMALESELEALPARIQHAKDLAADSTDDKIIADALAVVVELQQKEPALRIKLWHARRAYLQASLEETRTLETKLADEVAQVREEMTQAERALKAATSQRDATERKFKTAAGSWRGATMNVQQLAGELQQHEQRRPQI